MFKAKRDIVIAARVSKPIASQKVNSTFVSSLGQISSWTLLMQKNYNKNMNKTCHVSVSVLFKWKANI